MVYALSGALGPSSALAAQAPGLEFGEGWEARWRDFDLGRKHTSYAVTSDGETSVLEASSDGSASALLHLLRLPAAPSSRIDWSWRIESTLPTNDREREKKGDDYAARLFVIFDDDPFTRGARALCYVWASNEAIGERYPNPYYKNEVATIVIDSGGELAGEWVTRSRDFIADYRAAFGEAPEYVSGIALMVDTDDTKTSARAWFKDLSIQLIRDSQ